MISNLIFYILYFVLKIKKNFMKKNNIALAKYFINIIKSINNGYITF